MATRNIDQDEYSIDEEEEELDDSSMSLVEHLEELRWRILKSLIAIVVGGIVAFIFRQPILHFLTYPLPKTADAALRSAGDKLIVTGLAEGFTVYLNLSFSVVILIALPLILYQLLPFI